MKKEPRLWDNLRAVRLAESCDRAHLSHYAKMVLLIYVIHANADGSHVYVSNSAVAEQLNCSVESVKRGRRELLRKGYVQVVSGESGGMVESVVLLSTLGLDIASTDKPKIRGAPQLEPIPPDEDDNPFSETSRVLLHAKAIIAGQAAQNKLGYMPQDIREKYNFAVNNLMMLGYTEERALEVYNRRQRTPV